MRAPKGGEAQRPTDTAQSTGAAAELPGVVPGVGDRAAPPGLVPAADTLRAVFTFCLFS